jgi:dTDP-4-amino-4,6-dideoxygalactose transaminase
LTTQGVMVQKPYLSLHQMAVFNGARKEKFPVSEWYSSSALHLPLHSFMSREKAMNVIECCRSFGARSSDRTLARARSTL